jgi:DMSO reductase anchor subunit
MHILLDLLVWFNGVEILWPIPSWINLWSNVTPPEWWSKLMMSAEFFFFALFFVVLGATARKRGTDGGFLGTLRMWTVVQGVLFVIFTVLVYSMQTGFMTIYGALYLLSLGLAFGVTIRMRETIEATVR